MSSEEHVEEHISSGKDDFTVGQLTVSLKEIQRLVLPDVDKALGPVDEALGLVDEALGLVDKALGPEPRHDDAVATAADWEKFYATINTVNAPVASLDEIEKRVSAGTVIAAISLAIQIAQTLWNFFSGWDDKAVGDHCSVG